jgi:hypothetical protein
MANETYSGTSGSGPAAGVWAAIVTIDGSDQSARIVGEIRIDAEEGAARIAELTIRPLAGTTFAIAAWVGKPITIDVADFSSGSPADIRRLFTGLIDTPTLDLELRTISLRCTDNLQGLIDAMDNATVDALTPGGYHSPAIFDPAARGWVRLQDRLSTLPSALELDVSGSPRLTAWAPKVAPDMALTDAHLLDGSVDVALAGRNQLVNRIDVRFDYRFPRVKAENYPLAYQYVDATSIAQHALDLNAWLLREAVVSAIEGAGGTIEDITYIPLPNYAIGTWIPNPEADIKLCMGFDAEVSFDFGQTIEEQHSITVQAPNSIAAVGTMRESLQGALEGVYPPIQTAEHAMTLWKNDIMGIPPLDTATPLLGYTVAADVSLTTDTDRAAADDAMETLIQIAKVRIYGSHRGNLVRGRVALNPAIDLDQTIDVDVGSVHATGKCYSVSHVLSPETGEATTDFTIAICSVAGVGTSHPETTTAAPAGSSPSSTPLAFSATADFNYLLAEDHVFTVTFPDVETVEREKALIALASSYNAPLTEDTLVITL